MKKEKSENTGKGISRRNFIGKTAAATAAFTIVPRHVLGGPGFTAPSDMVNVAGIGLGNQGGSDIRNIATPDEPVGRGQGLPGMKWYRYPGITPPRPARQMAFHEHHVGEPHSLHAPRRAGN